MFLVYTGCHNRPPQNSVLSSGGCKSKVKVLAGLASPEAHILDLQMAAFSSHSAFSVVCHPLLRRSPVLLDEGPTHLTSPPQRPFLPNAVTF